VTEATLAPLAPLVGPDTIVVSTQNGVEAHDKIAAVFGAERTVAGVVRVLSYIEAQGAASGLVIRKSIPGAFSIGEIFPAVGVSPRVRRLAAALAAAGVAAAAEPDIRADAWEKLVGMACSGTVGGLARAPMKVCATLEPTRSMLIDAMAEVIAVAESEGVAMEPGFAVATADRYAAGPNNTTVSTIRDLCNGEVSEVLELSGAVVRIGRANGVPTPTHNFLQVCRAVLAVVLCCVVLCCAVLCCAVLCRAVLCRAVPCCAVLCGVVRCCAVLCGVVLCCAVLCCPVLCCVVLCCVVLCFVVLCCAVV
jgi:2-dehydropantoate 2-reductase